MFVNIDNGIATEIDSKDVSKLNQTLLYPFASMFKAFTGMGIFITQKGAPDAS